MKYKIIIPMIVCLLLVVTVTAEPRIRIQNIEDVNDNNFLNLNENNHPVSYNGYVIGEEEVNFYFNIRDYERNEEGNNSRYLRSLETTLENDVLEWCLAQDNNGACSRFINSNEEQEFNGRKIKTIKMQVDEEREVIRERMLEIKQEIRRNRNPLRNFLEGLEGLFEV